MLVVYHIICTALLAAFIILLLGKLGIRSYIAERCPVKFISQLVDCDFCLSFWAACLITAVVAICLGDITVMLIPLFSTPLTRFLL